MLKRTILLLLAAALLEPRTFDRTQAQSAPQQLPPTAEKAYAAVAARFDDRDALTIVSFMDQYWRLAGNPGFNASIDHVRDRLTAAGFEAPSSNAVATVRVDEFPNAGRGWDYRVGTLELEGDAEALLSRDRDRVSLAINSFSTPPGGLLAPLIDVGAGAPNDYAAKDIKGAVVLGDAPLGRLWQEAVKRRGAAGVVSTEIAGYIRPSDPSVMSERAEGRVAVGKRVLRHRREGVRVQVFMARCRPHACSTETRHRQRARHDRFLVLRWPEPEPRG